MTNTSKLKAAIVENNLRIIDVASAIGLSEQGFHKKLHNASEFKASEILAISRVLNLRYEDVDQIFFESKLKKIPEKRSSPLLENTFSQTNSLGNTAVTQSNDHLTIQIH